MKPIALLFAAAALVASPVAASGIDAYMPFEAETLLANPGPPGAMRSYLEGVVAASRLDFERAEARLRATSAALETRTGWQGPPNDLIEIQWKSLALAGEAALRAGRYREALPLFDRALAQGGDLVPDDDRAEVERLRAIAAGLSGQSPPSLGSIRAGQIALDTNRFGLDTLTLIIDGKPQRAVIDTGTRWSVLSESTAKALEMHVLGTDPKFAVAKTVSLGPITMHNVVFLVVDDAALSALGPDAQLNAIVGISILHQLGRLTFRKAPSGTRELVVAPSRRRGAGGNLRFDGFAPLVRLSAGVETIILGVDSGASRTTLAARYEVEHRAALASLPRQSRAVGNAGAIEQHNTATLPELTLTLAGRDVHLADVRVEVDQQENSGAHGTLGSDVLWAKGGYTIDFGALTLSLAED